MKGRDIIIGVYKIVNLKNNKVYIGSSQNIYRRWKEHIRMLNKNEHHSIKLQRAYNKSKNKKNFSFEIVEIVDDVDKIKDREQYYIDLYDAYNDGYNCCEMVDNLKYCLKNQKKALTNKKIKEQYDVFDEIFPLCNGKLRISEKVFRRIGSKEYKFDALLDINNMVKFYLEHFSNNNAHLSYCLGKSHLSIFDDNKIRFAIYNTNKHIVKFDSERMGMTKNYLINSNVYDSKIHSVYSPETNTWCEYNGE